ncbi:hypothetical protein HAX54_000210, partial [Datura stramonium]|nr:hypothetical protein [Datura stramonium]
GWFLLEFLLPEDQTLESPRVLSYRGVIVKFSWMTWGTLHTVPNSFSVLASSGGSLGINRGTPRDNPNSFGGLLLAAVLDNFRSFVHDFCDNHSNIIDCSFQALIAFSSTIGPCLPKFLSL